MPRWSFTYRSAFVVLAALILTGCPTTSPDSQPEANFVASPRIGNTGTTVSFSDLSTTVTGGDILSWQWNFGDGGRSNEPNPNHTYFVPGDFTVTLTVVSSGGSHTRTRSAYIRIESAAGSDELGSDGGTVSANGVSITVPEGALNGRVEFGITRVNRDIPFNVFEPINRVGDTFRITHDSRTRLSTSSAEVPFQTARLSIPYAEDVVPTGSRIPSKVHIVAQLATGQVIPIIGTIASGTVDAQVSDLPADATYTVVYRPEAYLATATVDTKAATSNAWNQTWKVSLSPSLLVQLTALRLANIQQPTSFFETDFTEEQLEATETALLNGILALQQEFESVQARSPRLISTNGAYTAIFYNFVQQYPTAIGSLDNVVYADSPFGSIVIDPRQLLAISTWNADRVKADASRLDIAQILSTKQAFGEELTRGVIGGYDYPEITATSPADGRPVNFSAGIEAGLALHIGQMAGGLNVNRSQQAGDKALLSTPVLAPFDLTTPNYSAASQDFFRYLENRYAADTGLGYIAAGNGAVKGILEEVRLALATLVSPTFTEAATLTSEAVDDVLFSRLDVTLGEAYYNYALDLAFEHGTDGVLRPSDEDRIPLVLDEDRFAQSAILTGNLSGPEDGLDFPGSGQTALTAIPPLSTRLIIFGADPTADLLQLSFNRVDWTADSRNRTIEVAVYREGLPGVALPANQSTLTLSGFEADLGQSQAIFYVIIVNTSTTTSSSVTLAIESSTTE